MSLNPLSRRVYGPIPAWIRSVAWSLLVLLAFELAIRFFVMRLPPYVYEAEWGFVPAENSTSMQGREGFGVLHYLSEGEIRTPFSGGTSIVVLGDSTVQAAQVNDAQNFVSLAEADLRTRGLQVDLHNLGRAERTMADHVFVAPAVEARFAPQLVIVQVSPASFSLAYDTRKENYFEVGPGGQPKLVHRDQADKLATDNFLFASGLLSFFNFRWQVTRQALTAEFVAPPEASATEGVALSFRDQVVSQAQALVDAFPNSQVVFLVIPYTPSIEPGEERSLSWVSGEDQALANILAKMNGARLIYVRDEFRKYYEKNLALPRGSFNSQFNFGHLNKDGHIVVAQALAEALEEILR